MEQKKASPEKLSRPRGDNLRLEIKGDFLKRFPQRFLALAISTISMWGLDDLLYIGIGPDGFSGDSLFLLQELKPFYLQWCWHITDVETP